MTALRFQIGVASDIPGLPSGVQLYKQSRVIFADMNCQSTLQRNPSVSSNGNCIEYIRGENEFPFPFPVAFELSIVTVE